MLNIYTSYIPEELGDEVSTWQDEPLHHEMRPHILLCQQKHHEHGVPNHDIKRRLNTIKKFQTGIPRDIFIKNQFSSHLNAKICISRYIYSKLIFVLTKKFKSVPFPKSSSVNISSDILLKCIRVNTHDKWLQDGSKSNVENPHVLTHIHCNQG